MLFDPYQSGWGFDTFPKGINLKVNVLTRLPTPQSFSAPYHYFVLTHLNKVNILKFLTSNITNKLRGLLILKWGESPWCSG